jgi:hypothetical protein
LCLFSFSFFFFFFFIRNFGDGFSKLNDESGIFDISVIVEVTISENIVFINQATLRSDDESTHASLFVQNSGSLTYTGNTPDPSRIVGFAFHVDEALCM